MLSRTFVFRSFDATAASKLLVAARSQKQVLTKADWTQTPPNEAEAYNVQRLVIAGLSDQLGLRIGYKVGASNAGARSGLGLQNSFYGPLWSNLTDPDKTEYKAKDFFLRVVEAEIAVVLADDLDGRATVDEIRAKTRTLLPVIEIVDTPFASDFKAMGGLNLIADLGAHGRFVVGTPIKVDPKAFDPALCKVTLSINGKDEKTALGGDNVEGGPYGMTAWLNNYMIDQGLKPLKRGDIISTGSIVAPYPANAGEAFSVVFDGLGTCNISFV